MGCPFVAKNNDGKMHYTNPITKLMHEFSNQSGLLEKLYAVRVWYSTQQRVFWQNTTPNQSQLFAAVILGVEI